ncbi:helix-turn-helix domain-containing protein, partial [Streptomyces sp. NPDC051016]|uniref:helix-turn-helix domain-containing protein n=1 Tax=Streptomyces sp. NPDC051016 TaxID=3365638 RepID=UPI0037B46F9B
MTDFDAIDALLAGARQQPGLPPAGQRRALRQALNLSRTQVAQVLGVSPSTVGGWEQGRDPSGEIREKYAYFLAAAQERLRPQADTPPHPALPHPASPHPAAGPPGSTTPAARPAAPAGDEPLPAPRPCVLCGAPATDQVEGYPQHLHPADCTRPTPSPPTAPHPETPAPAPARRSPPVPAAPSPPAPSP